MTDKPIDVLLIHRESDVYRHLAGWWSYPVDEFNWRVVKVKPEGFSVDMRFIHPKPDLVVMDDWIFGTVHNRKMPLAYVVVDSMRSPEQRERNRIQARQADVILVDSDRLDSFDGLGKVVKRFAYAVNERLFFPHEKVYDVAFLCWPTPERRIVQGWCEDICRRHGWSLVTGTYEWHDYARFLSSAKVVVHKPHVANGRSWRVFDVMAARGCLLTMALPNVSGDDLVSDVHYREYSNAESLEKELDYLLYHGFWRLFADAGYEHVMANHIWKIRAAQLRDMLREVFRHDESRMALW